MSEYEDQIARLVKQIESLEYLRDQFGDDVIEQKIAGLRDQLAALGSESVPTTGGAAIFGNVQTGGGSFVGRDQVLAALGDGSVVIGGDNHGIVIITPQGQRQTRPAEQVTPEVLLRAYYRSLAGECRRLPLGAVDPRFAQPLHEGEVSLAEVYTDLDVVAPPQKEEDQDAHTWGLHMARGEGEGRTPLLEALARPEAGRIVLLGDPGSGKTTFANYLAYLLAEAQSGDAAALPALPAALRGRLPARLVLRGVAAHLPCDAERGTARMLWTALRSEIAACLGDPAARRLLPYLQQRLLKEPSLFLLDGLDEVPEAGRRRKCLLEAIHNLAASLPAEGRILLTARPYAYADPAWRLPGFQVLALAPFDAAQVAGFVRRWYQAVRPALGWDVATAQARAARLSEALENRPYLADLASRPLLLTLMATLHSSWGQLPEDRADLYEESVKLLLSRWQRNRAHQGVTDPGIARVLGLDDDRLRRALEKLAYDIHARQGQQSGRDDAPADIPVGDVLAVLSPAAPDDFNPTVLVNYLETRAGLLLARREGVYAFPHRSFQEFLAGSYLTRAAEFAARLRALLWADADWWREVALLGLGKLRQGGEGNVISALNVLLPEGPQETAVIEDGHYHLAALAGQAVLELRLDERAADQGHYPPLRRRIVAWLRRLLDEGRLAPRPRLAAGDTLGRLGDPRPGVGLLSPRPSSGEGPGVRASLPDITWCAVPAGSFVMGSAQDDDQAYADERPAHTLELPLFYISRYPITNAQYRPFLENGGYQNPAYWTAEGWAWRQGAEADLTVIDDDGLRQNYQKWLAGRPAEKRGRPFWWEHSQWGGANRPVVGVCWYEALAYTAWLNQVLQAEGASQMPASGVVRLPSEAEWEKAARGPHAQRWPWGDTWEAGRANMQEAGLQQTSPVGLFPGGASLCGAQDLSGNVWEWTRSQWGQKSLYRPDYVYPYQPGDGREGLSGPSARVLRGGSWLSDGRFVRCASRGGLIPGYFNYDVGFRVVLSLAVSGS